MSFCDLCLEFSARSDPDELNMGVTGPDLAVLLFSLIWEVLDGLADLAAWVLGLRFGSIVLFAPWTGGEAESPAVALCSLVIILNSAMWLYLSCKNCESIEGHWYEIHWISFICSYS